MKLTVKFLTIAAMVLLTTAVFVNAQPKDDDGPADGSKMGGGERFADKVLDNIRTTDPNEAARLEKLREDDPQKFRAEIRAAAMKNMPEMEREHKERRAEMMNRPEGGPEMGARDGDKPMERGRERMRAMEGELMTWLQKNEPAEANSLAALKTKDPQAYMRKISIDVRKYRQIMETEDTNPALAEVLKNELKLKQQRNDLLEKFKAATDDKQKETTKTELKGVMSQLFDVNFQKQQIKYEELKKKLEELQKRVNKSQTELETFKNDKDALVDKELEDIISPSGKFNWD